MAAKKKWLFTLYFATFISLFLYFFAITDFSASSALFSRTPSFYDPFSVRHGASYPPVFAYYILGSRGHKDRVLRLQLAVYHPRNRYLLHLGTEASDREREELVVAGRAVEAVQAFGNVDVVGKPDVLTYMGSSTLAAMLHATAAMLRLDGGWNWFVTLSTMDYPLLTQDGMVQFNWF